MTRDTKPQPVNTILNFREYRMYLGPEFWLITYKDADFIKVMRKTEHGNGFCLLVMEILWESLTGTRTAIRERWAMAQQEYNKDGAELHLKARGQHRRVIEFWFERGDRSKRLSQQPVVKEDEGESK